MGFAVAFDLSDFKEGLPLLPTACVISIDRLIGLLVTRQEHRSAGQVAVMRNGDGTSSGLVLIAIHEGPQILNILRVVSRERSDLFSTILAITEDHNPVQISTARLTGPFEADQRCEDSWLVVGLSTVEIGPPLTRRELLGQLLGGSKGYTPDELRSGLNTLPFFNEIMKPLPEIVIDQALVGTFNGLLKANTLGVISNNDEIMRASQLNFFADT